MSETREIIAAIVLLLAPAWLFGWILREAVRLWKLHAGELPVESQATVDPISNPQPTTHSTQPTPTLAFLAVAGWLSLSIIGSLWTPRGEPREVAASGIQLQCVMFFIIWAMVLGLLTQAGQRPLREAGLFFRGLHWQVMLGWLGFLASLWPTVILLILGSPWRSEETQHILLQALRGPSGGELLPWIIVSAVLSAPLTEELLFRVTLQGWLSERLPGPVAIGLTAVVFALVHGWRDALPLIPLSLILGYLFYQTRSYWACVTAHAVFNMANIAGMLLLTNGE
jgi:membrane protease YdiL (CAAX protease family)